MNVLIIGAGAVGQVFARHLQDGGANITFLVREHHRDHFESTDGQELPLYLLNEGKNKPPHLFNEFKVLYSIDELSSSEWDQVWFCVPSNILELDWIEKIAEATGNASLIILAPEGPTRLDLDAPQMSRILFGLITFISWQCPLENEVLKGPKGVAYWFPFMSKVPLMGPKDRLDPILKMLKEGKMPVEKGNMKSAGTTIQIISAVLIPLVAGLECADWSFSKFSKGKWGKIVSEAAFEAYQVTGKKESSFVAFLFWMAINPFTLSIGLLLIPFLMPFHFEKYMKFHFMKVREQTIWMLKGMLEDGMKKNIDTPNIKSLSDQII